MPDSLALPFPPFRLVRRRLPRPRVDDVAHATARELEKLFPVGSPRPGAEIGVTVGSRGIRDIATIVRAAVGFLRGRGARPFIIPAMGSHGGATPEGQRRLIAHYGVTEEALGAPVRDAMDARLLGRTLEGVQAFLAETALASDGVVVLNRVKPHTDFKGRLESGLAKMCAIGLGKLEGARECHTHTFGIGLGAAIAASTRAILATGKILGGLAVLENPYHETAHLEAVRADELFDREARLLGEARGLLGTLPLDEIDVLVCDRMGKNVSGTGLDTNVIGRSVQGWIAGVPWQPGMATVWRIVVRGLTPESEGNAVGLGLVDFAPARLRDQVDYPVTLLNALTAFAPANARLPAILPTDREAIAAALSTAPDRPGGRRVACIRDTLSLDELLLSESCLPPLRDRDDVEVLSEPAPLRFGPDGEFVSPFER